MYAKTGFWNAAKVLKMNTQDCEEKNPITLEMGLLIIRVSNTSPDGKKEKEVLG